jgi:O-acetyl-ADP-ribose deacetylase (regulator of RNase III)
MLQRRDFRNDQEDPSKKEKYQAEALIYKYLPVNGLAGLVSYSDEVKLSIDQAEKTRDDRQGRQEARLVLLMIELTTGNLLDADVEALVNTVNTVGVMGKGVALMFKEAFPENFKAYEAACKRKEVRVGRMFVTERGQFIGPKFIINFPTKQHWRNPAKIEWIEAGLEDLKRVIIENDIHSIAIPPLGSGNGGLIWSEVRKKIEAAFTALPVRVVVYEPTSKYQNVAKRTGVEKLTPARALVAELVRRYWILAARRT